MRPQYMCATITNTYEVKERGLPLSECVISNSKKKNGDRMGEKHKTSREFRPQCMKRIGAQWTSSFCPGKPAFHAAPTCLLQRNKVCVQTNLL